MATPPPSDNSGLFGAVGTLFTKAKDVVVKTVAPLESTTPPPTLPGAAPEGAGRTLTGGRRHRRKTRGGKRRSTRKTMRRHRRGGEVDDSGISSPDVAFQYAKSQLRKVPAPLGGKHTRKTKKGGRKYY